MNTPPTKAPIVYASIPARRAGPYTETCSAPDCDEAEVRLVPESTHGYLSWMTVCCGWPPVAVLLPGKPRT